MRIVSWNVNGLGGVALDDVVRDLAPDVLCLQEVRAAPPMLDGYARAHALAERGRRYGVATFVRAGLTATHARVPWDREGRVLVTHLDDIAIVNVYMVNGTPRP